MNNFNSLDLRDGFLENLTSLNYIKMTDIQKKSLPLLLKNNNLIAQSKTGSGKTVSFSIPIVNKLKNDKFAIQSMIICPTRELANQVAKEIKKLCRFINNIKILTLCGGVPYKPQVHSLSHKAHIIVGTPGRLLKHISENNIELENIDTLVLDEADKMLDMGFYDDIIKIVEVLPKKRQNMLFSATYDEQIMDLSKSITDDAIFVKDESVHSRQKINQVFYEVDESQKIDVVDKLIHKYKAKSVLIFCNRKYRCEEIADELFEKGFDSVVLHSDLDQNQRDETIVLFSNKSYPIMIATDVASRGLDITDIDLVINYDIAKDEKVHTHRVGRTARASSNGTAVTLYNNEDIDIVLKIKEQFDDISFLKIDDLKDILKDNILKPMYATLYINGGKKDKLRAGDIVGALINKAQLNKDDIGNIDIFRFHSYVAIKKEFEQKSLKALNSNKIKQKEFRVYPR
ncbi:ATP-dependent RNA helicase DbpA [Malaciobacter molluscorum LMG 25693]|uniref:ATP-dependent RNA helicase DbpA n=1 Tax=Malaciobacter molluscorum LMG 25693 TaxID=870501 RepID=A0A2G1DIJ8_9BACT|nr:ATP-dependent RNA helicase DbpA [Malaciobacter molluscorum]PHO18339.1 ATP-dependent RNA helicase DbpA [Malaciobacter molluscorum LMG 25693]